MLRRVFKVFFIATISALSVASVALAQQAQAPQTLSEVLPRMLPMFIAVFFIFYFLVIRPQQSRLRQQQSLHESLKKGDTVATTGGMIGRIHSVADGEVQLEVSNGVRIKFEREHIVKKIDTKVPAKSAA